ncbi:MAG TPA: hypothetical protein VGX48_25185 [Pyrinomonadaceae bacterium]|jgi:hypothetical protein|nr:hypothetical protein [Pyrinomonadaceae bacterium]
MSLTIFGPETSDGVDLVRRVTALAEGLGYTVEPPQAATQSEMFEAVIGRDVVIFDGTVEDEQRHIYHAAAMIPSVVDHLLVVSRTYLPINFIPARRGGAPDYPFPHFDPRLDRVRQSWSNEMIVEWLRAQLLELRERGPRDKEADIRALAAAKEPEDFGRAIVEFYRRAEPRAATGGRAFISYRSRVWDEAEALRGRIERGELHGGRRLSVEVLRPGALAYEGELLTAMRRWQLLSLIDRIIAGCAEVIAYGGEGYLDSWWTRGEVMTLAYRRGSGSESRPELKVHDPRLGPTHLADAPPELTPVMTERQLRRMARWYAHTDPLSMGPENVAFCRKAHKIIRYVPSALLGFFLRRAARLPHARMMAATGGELGGGDNWEAAMREFTDPAAVKEFFGDEVWSDAFWDDVLFECPRRPSPAPRGTLDPGGFLTARPPHMIALPPDRMSEVVARGAISCPTCRGEHPVVAAPPRYLWAPLRHGLGRTETRTGLMRLETYAVLTAGRGEETPAGARS